MSGYLPTKTTRVSGRERSGLPRPFADPRTPLLHAKTHQHGGGDEVAAAVSGANQVPKAGAAGELAAGWLPAATTGAKGAVKSAAADPNTARGTVTNPAAGSDTVSLSSLQTMRTDIHTELDLLHTELNDLKQKLRDAGVLAT